MTFTEQDKIDFLECWKLSGEEGERVWQAKLAMHATTPDTHTVMGDIQPYQSMVDGTMITSRSQHREMLKKHNLIEIGNETKHLKPYGEYKPTPGLKEMIADKVYGRR